MTTFNSGGTGGGGGGASTAADAATSTGSFDGLLSGAEDNTQKALDKLDDLRNDTVTLTVTAQNTISDLPSTPAVGGVDFFVNGVRAAAGIAVAGTVVTVTPGTLGHNIETTDTVTAKYLTT